MRKTPNRPRGGRGKHPAPRPNPAKKGRRRAAPRGQPDQRPGGELWLYGTHPVAAALANPARRCHRLLATGEAWAHNAAAFEPLLRQRGGALVPERVSRQELAALLPPAAVHQGLALSVLPLAQPALAELLARAAESSEGTPRAVPGSRSLICALDQVTDPQNVGAILRSAAAFGATALLTTARNAAPESGALAKAASGALDRLPYLQEPNLARALENLKAAGYWVLGLAAEGEKPLAAADPGAKAVLVLGAEGSGLRRLTRERCDELLRLPTEPGFGQLNVANAAAIAFYELLGRGRA